MNIGIELVAKPSLLFLDEPTTGIFTSTFIFILFILVSFHFWFISMVIYLTQLYLGLDSASAKDVVSCLHEIARMGITVVAVVHQPRFDILSLCDDLLLLGKGIPTSLLHSPRHTIHCGGYYSWNHPNKKICK